ncbi:MAG: hypothetical protein V4617_02950 [Gemmatimonadota bacterium]
MTSPTQARQHTSIWSSMITRVFPVVAMILTAASSASAQDVTIIDRMSGSELRKRGDSIWTRRDSAMQLEVHRGDTSTRTNYVHGLMRWSVTFLRVRDSVRVIAATGAPGAFIPYVGTPGMHSRTVANFNREALVRAHRIDSLARLGQLPLRDLPRSPDTLIVYPLNCRQFMTHHADTIRRIVERPNSTIRDSSVFVLFGDDSVRRVWPFPRTFDRYVASSLRNDLAFSDRIQRAKADPSLGIRVATSAANPCPK